MSKVLLLVYGTLRDRLEQYQIGTDTVKGELYDVGHYPALVNVGTGEDDIEVTVHSIPESMLPALDHYEGAPFLYQRLTVQTSYGPAYIYQYNRSTENLTRIKEWRTSL